MAGADAAARAQETGGFADVAPVHLVSTASMADAAHAEECDACDVTAPRANLVVDLAPTSRGGRRSATGSGARSTPAAPR